MFFLADIVDIVVVILREVLNFIIILEGGRFGYFTFAY